MVGVAFAGGFAGEGGMVVMDGVWLVLEIGRLLVGGRRRMVVVGALMRRRVVLR